jgi:hypothetical protein
MAIPPAAPGPVLERGLGYVGRVRSVPRELT